MRLLYKDADGRFVTREWPNNVPRYAVLSHTWLIGGKEEILHEDIVNGSAEKKSESYEKLRFCAKQAARDGFDHFWIDTCCIDKTSSSELQEAITSMFRWYRDAGKCYAYLTDVSAVDDGVGWPGASRSWEGDFRRSRWFTRGWTLQELLAPTTVEFYSAEGTFLGDKKSLKHIIQEITGIPPDALEGTDLSGFSAYERLSWASTRETTRAEDQAYCLLGILDIDMTLRYGETTNAMIRLRQKIEKKHGEVAKWDRLIEGLPIASQAAYDSLDNQYGSTCLPNTRVELLGDLSQWANAADDRCIYWLNGSAGTGKSTVARTIARTFSENDILGGSFFFEKGGGAVSHANLLFTTLASQLATRFSSVKRHICESIMANPDIAQKSLRDQWDQLIINPLSKVENFEPHNLIIVLDALDECGNEQDVHIILRLISTTRTLERIRLRVLVTSRPETPIRSGFSHLPEAEREVFFLHDIRPALINRDLNLFFQENLAAIGVERRLAPEWPGSRIVARLVEISSGLFIWASTACRWIRNGKKFATKRLETIIKGHTSDGGPQKQLDEIYTTVLESLVQQEYDEGEKQMLFESVRDVVGHIVTLFSPLSSVSLASLLDQDVEEIRETLEDLHTIFNIPSEESRPIRLHHPTFRDFIIDQSRCKNPDLWVDKKQAHKALAEDCIEIMRRMLKRDICGLQSPGVLVTDVDQSCIERCIPPELQYACLYWAQHCRQSGMLLGENDTAYHFLKEHYLHWLEAMNLMGKGSEIAAIIRMYQALLPDSDNSGQLSFLKDARRFFFSFQLVMERTPLQIYCAALVFLRPSNGLKDHFWSELHPWFGQVKVVDAIAPDAKDEYMFVNDLAFSPDGKEIASASIGPVIRVWDVKSKTALFVYHGQKDKTGTVAISPDGKMVASGSDDASVMVWNRETRAVMFNLEGHTRWVNTVVYSPDGRILASGSMDETIRLWDATNGEECKRWEGDLSCINSIAFSPDGKYLASATSDWLVRIWDVSKNIVHLVLDGHSGPVNTVQFSPDGTQLVSGSDDMTIKVWDTISGVELFTLKGHVKKVSAVTFSPDARLIVSGSEDKTMRLWDVSNRSLSNTLEGHVSGINAVCYSKDGQILAAGAYNDEIRFWDAVTGEPRGKLNDFASHQLGPGSLEQAYGHDSGFLEGATEGGKAHTSEVLCLALSPDRKLVASGSQDSTIKIWTISGVEQAKLVGHSRRITCLVFHPSGRLLASSSADATVVLWDISTSTILHVLQGHTDMVLGLRFSPSGDLLASHSSDKTIRLWKTWLGTAEDPLEGHHDTVTSIAFSPDGRLLASGSADTTVRLWNIETSNAVGTALAGHEDEVTSVAFSTLSDLVASCSMNGTIRLWTADGKSCGVIQQHTKGFSSVTFSPDSKFLISSSGDHIMTYWDCQTKALLARVDAGVALRNLSFSASCQIETDRGVLTVNPTICDKFSCSSEALHSSFVTDDWLLKGKEKALWLPEEYKTTSVITHEGFAVLGHSSGSITFISLQ
ncbi:Vegetative incompatibility protein [Alternaria arborescens]|uniref:Vegetative incompatibility protein n=1 Tax=Alternaria arborescens TaxID=156630 RepID=UPI001074D603|nr:Vegetative incompatibility protein [Alternaria arborescens]RYO27977.1 Vegetative incompatibility protein [Alternaria arborescens]